MQKQIKPLGDKLNEMSACNSFKELIYKYGNEKELLHEYEKGLEFAPDKKRYIGGRIHIFQETLLTLTVTNSVWDFVNKKSISIQCGYYKRLGFEWVNNGFDATKEDFDLLIYRNTDLSGLHITNEDKNLIYISKFRLLAEGGALAFHIAYLRNELNNYDLTKEQIVNLASIFNEKNNSFNVCKELMDELDLTINGKPNPKIKIGRMGNLTGLIRAIKSQSGMLKIEKPTDMELLSYFNAYLNTRYVSFSIKGNDYNNSLLISKDYIKKHLKK
ncbi:MAG TPA: hypothetical protein VMU83_03840 [Hanamia sp.]|nr:hypothetical protein [Hanamia sp.]